MSAAHVVAALVCAGFPAYVDETGTLIVGHVLDLKFEPYQMQRINNVGKIHEQETRPRTVVPPLMKVDRPADKYEYWDYLTEKALEHHQKLQDNAAERKAQREENIANLRKTIEDLYGPRTLPHLAKLVELGTQVQQQKLEELKDMQKEIDQPQELK